MKFYEIQAVRTTIAFKEHGAEAGETGTVALCFTKPREAYEVEFVNEDGSTRAMFAIEPKYLEPLE